ncbi:tapetum determinant protein [Perilla frutescens var. hirtella]|nr:tapetum determinant protein [Perilla frutescens var. hirtella]
MSAYKQLHRATGDPSKGILTCTMEIMNICVSSYDTAAIQLSFGWFSFVRLVKPYIFNRLHFNDCIVNDRKPLLNGRTLSFQYANTFCYSLSVFSIIRWNLPRSPFYTSPIIRFKSNGPTNYE